MSELYRLVYTSRNLLTGTEEERAADVAEILATSQANNARVGVSGALLFNGGSFAQVLEGPRAVVESTFERIQRDIRHSDVNVLQCEAVGERGFPNWSMAFVGHSAVGRAMWSELAGRTGFDLSRIEGEDLFATLHSIVLAEEGLAAEQASGEAANPLRSEGTPSGTAGLDVERVRTALQAAMPAERSFALPAALGVKPASSVARPDAAASLSEADVLRSALDAERERTTRLRRDLDEARVALARQTGETDEMRRQRDLWAARTRSLAAALMEQPATLPEREIKSVA